MNLNQAELNDLVDIATRISRNAGKLALTMRDGGEIEVDTKSSGVDMVTAADKAAEQLIVEQLLEARPDDGLVGEEGASKESATGITWHIDPIDGTTNFIYGREFGVSMGAAIGDKPIAGVVFEPTTDTLYSATLGGGSFANGTQLRVNRPDSLAVSLVATGFGYKPEARKRQAEVLVDLIPQIRDIRRKGVGSLDLIAVATGIVDGYYELGLWSWDTAAGILIASEAGAIVTPFVDAKHNAIPVVAAAPLIFDALYETAQKLVN